MHKLIMLTTKFTNSYCGILFVDILVKKRDQYTSCYHIRVGTFDIFIP